MRVPPSSVVAPTRNLNVVALAAPFGPAETLFIRESAGGARPMGGGPSPLRTHTSIGGGASV
eukprot:13120403-Alexandrium_andersonii.AAC.1